ncbi:BamA/TamA family outer membrane protein [Limibacter armeniacum]|uniref:BamA/TamA family outer membrane protein n=1 Tax=Limibacter armeniacum TaxID=466084 RepID=UPI002FE60946
MNKNYLHSLLSLLLCFPVILFAQERPSDTEKSYTILLIGDGGDAIEKDDNVTLLKERAKKAGVNSAVIYLGDNVYPWGVREGDDLFVQLDTGRLFNQLSPFLDYKGDIVMIPGNHDWNQGSRDGYAYIIRENAYVDKLMNKNVLIPDGGCPGPIAIPLNDEILMVVLDTEWMVFPWDKPKGDQCDEIETEEDVISQLEDIIKSNSHKKIIVVGHHPMYTYGSHGGKFSFNDHVFPLTLIKPWLYVPLPIIGSIHPLSRKLGISPQDKSNFRYKYMVERFEAIFKEHPNLIYAAGHEHSLQHIVKDSVQYIVSGSGSKTTYVKGGSYSRFHAEEIGFAEVSFYKDGAVWVDFYVGKGDKKGEVIYSQYLFTAPYQGEPEPEIVNVKAFADSTVMAVASDQYTAGKSKRNYMGDNYRDVWKAPVEVPVFDIGSEHGGLKIVKRGGGMQTRSLRLEAPDEKQYVLRSVEKYPAKAIPVFLRGTVAEDIVQDQISASNPYGAYIVPSLAEAAGIYHTNPKLVYVPDDPRFGDYREEFANGLYLYEERPDDDWSDAAYFGNSEKIYSTGKVLEKVKEDNDNVIDYKFVLRSRLFDMVIADWDRHDDQWRWASFENEGKGKMFRPIPRDRDQVFFINEGILPKIASRKWALPKLEGFNDEIRWPEGLAFNARYFDRSFLSEASEEEWIAEADSLKARLTDASIEKAVAEWPDTVQALVGSETVRKLKARRDKIPEYAAELYTSLAKEVDVTGSDKKELFEVERKENGETAVTVRKISKKGNLKQELYHRTFYPDETKEVRLYGFGGEDEFKLNGTSKNGIKVRIIGGEGEDVVEDNSNAGIFLGNGTLVYDTKGDTKVNKGKDTRLMLSDDVSVNNYNRKAYKPNVAYPLLFATYNVDDLLIIGGGTLIQRYGFRKEPFSSQHLILLGISPFTAANRIVYRGDFTKVLGDLALSVEADINVPTYVSNFAGLGNENEYDGDNFKFYRLNHERSMGKIMLKKFMGERQRSHFAFGAALNRAEIDEDRDNNERFIGQFAEENEGVFETHYNYLGAQVNMKADGRDRPMLPTYGAVFEAEATAYAPLSNDYEHYFNLKGEGSIYYSFRLPTLLTLAGRVGGAANFGDYSFIMSNRLGGVQNLRGYRKEIFWGRHYMFTNLESRLQLFRINTPYLRGSGGVSAFWDSGRVWLDGEDSDKWHNGFGGGFFVAPFNIAALSLYMSFSEEDSWLFNFRFGFSF